MQDKVSIDLIDSAKLPRHIALIMDGNGRWAKKRGLSRILGHRKGVEAFERIVYGARELNIEVLSVYAFSTENWKRPAEEVGALMNLLVEFVDKKIDEINKNGIRINHIGTLEGVDERVAKKLNYAQNLTANNDKMILNLAFNYGSREEILHAVKEVAQNYKAGRVELGDINENYFENYLYTKNQPDPDLVIRTSGELRLSNFLLWQVAYSEMWVSDIYWPDFQKEDLWQAVIDYQNRSRRFGGLEDKQNG